MLYCKRLIAIASRVASEVSRIVSDNTSAAVKIVSDTLHDSTKSTHSHESAFSTSAQKEKEELANLGDEEEQLMRKLAEIQKKKADAENKLSGRNSSLNDEARDEFFAGEESFAENGVQAVPDYVGKSKKAPRRLRSMESSEAPNDIFGTDGPLGEGKGSFDNMDSEMTIY